ncbi:MAG: isoaspartyl peptidase/L-asparaginase [Sphingomonas bacterium]
MITPLAARADTSGYEYYAIGNTARTLHTKTSPGLMLVGGGDWSRDAFHWFADRAGNGHIVILRASGGAEGGDEMFREIGGVASVETLVFHDRKASADPRVLSIIAHADGIFIAGGDQARYVRYWKDTPVARALDTHVRKGRPIGGTSAGLAILGGTAYGALDGGSIDSIAALNDPAGPAVTMVRGFLRMPYLAHVVTDTHFNKRDRLGRLIAFVANARANGDARAIGLGVDERGALCVDGRGMARFHGPDGTFAWLIQPRGMPKLAREEPLDWADIRITGIAPGQTIDLRRMQVSAAAFSSIVSVKDGRLSGVPLLPDRRWSLAVHAGAHVLPREAMTPEQDRTYRKGLSDALEAGSAVLRTGGSSLDAVEAAVKVLEDNPLFDAGRGAAFNAEGQNRLEAAIMDGASQRAGAVAGVSATKNPVALARSVMDHSSHILLTGAGADRFAREYEVEQVDPSYFRTDESWRDYEKWKQDPDDSPGNSNSVGAVALDMHGHLAAATSAGGLTGALPGRVGDTPMIGVGTYAYGRDCAVSATGSSEYLIRETAARQICDRMKWRGATVAQATQDTMAVIDDLGGDGGLLAMDGDGKAAFAMDGDGMYRGSVTSGEAPKVAIWSDETADGK